MYDGVLRSERIRQKLARARYDLCRGTTPLHRIALRLRPTIPWADGETEGRGRQRPVACNEHRTKDDEKEPAFDRRNGDGSLRLPACPVRTTGASVRPALPNSHRNPNRR